MATPHISAFQTEFDISITLTFYSTWYYPQTTRRKFQLRNLMGETVETQTDHARQIMDEVAAELYYLSGFGIDKGVVQAGTTKLFQTTYPDLTPKIDKLRFSGMLIQFTRPSTYTWVKDGADRWYVPTDDLENGWQRVAKLGYKTKSFRIPVVALRQPHDGYMSFFRFLQPLTRKRKRTSYGFSVLYDREDSIFVRFLDRFQETGNLALGERNFFNSENGYINFEGRPWPKSKAKSEKMPRKSRLASQPVDNIDYVYIIRAGRTNLYKIGKSNDPQGRLDNLQTANPYKLKLIHTFKADNASAAEEELHGLLCKKQMEGEWFRLSIDVKNRLTNIAEYRQNNFRIDNEGIEPDRLFDTL